MDKTTYFLEPVMKAQIHWMLVMLIGMMTAKSFEESEDEIAGDNYPEFASPKSTR